MDERISELMTALNVTEDEARQILADDEAIDHGQDLFPQTAEQKKASKQACATGTRTAYNFTKRERKADNDKRALIAVLHKALAFEEKYSVDNIFITNPERQIDFTYNGRSFRIVLSAPRAPK